MATNHFTPNLARWNSTLADHDAAEAALVALKDLAKSRVHDDIIALAAEAKDRLFRIPSPTISALRRKLETFWTDLWEETPAADAKRGIIGDLTRIELLLLGAGPEEVAVGMDLKRVASDFAAAARDYDHYVELHREGPSDKWGASTTSDIVALMDQAEAKMLSLPAPNLPAVEKKLTAMWIDQRYDPIEATTAHVTILRDLRRLIIEHQ